MRESLLSRPKQAELMPKGKKLGLDKVYTPQKKVAQILGSSGWELLGAFKLPHSKGEQRRLTSIYLFRVAAYSDDYPAHSAPGISLANTLLAQTFFPAGSLGIVNGEQLLEAQKLNCEKERWDDASRITTGYPAYLMEGEGLVVGRESSSHFSRDLSDIDVISRRHLTVDNIGGIAVVTNLSNNPTGMIRAH